MITPELATLIAAGAAAWVLILLVAALAIGRANRTREELGKQTRQLARRAEQLQLLNRLSSALPYETRRRGVVRAAVEFFVVEMDAGRAVFWRPDSDGEPQDPWISYPGDGHDDSAPPLLPEAQRIILARAAGRGTTPLILRSDSQDQRPQALRLADTPPMSFVLYVPLGASPREGVLEIYSGRASWGPDRWELLAPLITEFVDALQRARRYEEIRERADIDIVTGLFNHRYMHVYLQRLLSSEATRESNFSVLLMDVDNFKAVNDTYGHSIGDRVLQTVADQLKLMTDRVGVVGRFGGDEFIVILPGHAREEARAFGQAFQDWLTNYALKIPAGRSLSIAVSWGLAVFPDDGDRRQELLAVADARLYERKRSHSTSRNHSRNGNTGIGIISFLDGLVTSIDSKDHYTRAHCESAAEYALMLAEEVGLSPAAQRILRLAALLHDVGKICIPDEILRKPSQLTADEFAVIKHHVSITENLIVDVPNADEVREIARHHHERFDGSGYPDGLKGEEIPFLARVLALADAFSAITLDRPYRKSLPRDRAYAELQRVADTQLDPDLVKVFGRVLMSLEDEAIIADARV